MKKLLCACAALILALTTLTAFASTDVTGSWTTQMASPSGDSVQITFTFKQDGTTLTGSIVGSQGNPIDIKNGKIDGDKLTFDVTFNDVTISHQGTVSADEIKLTTRSNRPDFPSSEFTLKRAK